MPRILVLLLLLLFFSLFVLLFIAISKQIKFECTIYFGKRQKLKIAKENREKKHGEKQKYMASIHKNRKSPDTMNVANIF